MMEYPRLIDTTSERETEADVRHLLGLLNDFPVYAMLVDADHRILLANEAVRQDLGLDPVQIIGGYCPKVVHGLDGPFSGCPLEEAVRKGHAIEKEFIDPGSGRWLEGVIYPTQYRTEDDRDVFFHMVRDVNEKKQAQEALRESKEHLRLVVEQMGGILWTTDTELRITSGQGAGLKELDLDYDGEATPLLFDYFQTDDPTYQPIAAHRRALAGESVTYEMAWQDAIYQSHLEPLRDETGDIIGVIGVAIDVTEHKEVEKQLQRQERLAAVGQMAGGIAHDFRNLLSTIILYAQMSLRDQELPSNVVQALETIVDESHRASQLVQQILDFSGRSTMTVESLNLASLIEEMIGILRRTIREDVRLSLEIGSEDYTVKANPTRMQQVLLNLTLNAQDAMPEGGELNVGLSRVAVRPGKPSAEEAPHGEWICLTVSDTGTGMTEEVQAHLFEPFFTTKEAGKGSGLGLAQVYGIVKQHGGYVDVETEWGEGSTFRVYLPAHEAEGGAGGEIEEHTNLPQGRGETILLVEDEEKVREAGREILTSLGYRVLTAANGREALETHRSTEEIDLVITDLVMPEMGGQQLLEKLKKNHSGPKALVITGCPQARSSLDSEDGRLDAIQKPLEANALARAVRRVLDAD